MTLLCYGDSNTYGFGPRSYFGGRYPAEVRWTHRLAQATGWTVHNAGENGREIPRRAWELQDLLRRAADADLVTLMLGGNDLLQGPPFAAEDAAARMDTCLTAPAPMLGVLDQCRPVPPGYPPGPLLPGLGSEAEGDLRRCRGLGGGAAL